MPSSRPSGRRLTVLWPALVIIVSWRLMSTCSPQHANIKLVPAATLVKVDGVTVYEKTSKLIFRVPINSLHIDPLVKNVTGPLKGLYRLANMVADDIREELQSYNPVQEAPRRPKRQIVAGLSFIAGYAAHSLYSRISKKLFGGDDDMHRYVSELKSQVAEDQHEIVLLQTHVQGYADAVSFLLKEAMETQEATSEAVLHTQVLMLQRDWIMESKFACLSRQIPSRFVPQGILFSHLRTLNSRLSKYNMTLAIPLERMSELYKLPVADCLVTDKEIIVSVNVPLKRAGESWRIFEMVHTKFAYHGQTCSLYPHEQNFLAKSDNRAVLITSHMLSLCPIHEHGLCYIPGFSRDNSGSLACALALLEGKPVGEVASVCAFTCTPHQQLVVQQWDEHHVVLTNARSLEIQCPQKTEKREFELVGAVKVPLRCNCTMVVNNDYIMDPPVTCPPDGLTEDVVVMTPNSWSSLSDAIGSFTQYYSKHSNATLNPYWSHHVPTLNVTIYKPKPLPDLDYSVVGTYRLIDFFVGCLIISNCILWVVVIFIICAYIRA